MAAAPSAERVYFVPRRDILAGAFPLAEPVLLVDAVHAHRYVGTRQLIVSEAPTCPDQAPKPAEALPVFAIDWAEAMDHEGARTAIVVQVLDRAAQPELTRELVAV